MRTRVLVLVLLAAALGAPAPAAAFGLGIRDQKPDMFSDQRFLDLGIHDARLAVGRVSLHSGGSRPPDSQWLAPAWAACGVDYPTNQHSPMPAVRQPPHRTDP